MAANSLLLRLISSILLLVGVAQALKFDLQAHTGHETQKKERCIRNIVGKDTLVVVTATIGGYKGDGMQTNIHIRDATGNEYGQPRDVVGESRTVFTSHSDSAFDVCFENLKTSSVSRGLFMRSIELDIDIGADAKDWSAIQATEKLKPIEADLLHIEETTVNIVKEMEYMRAREQNLRDTNESTNSRVKWFGIGTTWLLVALWAWQIMYLRAYFRSKHLI